MSTRSSHLPVRFENWASLKRHIEAISSAPQIEIYERIAADLVAACDGDAMAVSRLADTFHVALSPEQVRTLVQERLASIRGEVDDHHVTVDDTKLLTARLYGFDDWNALAASVGSTSPDTSGGTHRGVHFQPFYKYDEEADTLEIRAPLAHRAVSDRGAANLAFCHRLEFVDLMGTATGDGAVHALRGKTHMRRLYAGNGVTDAGLSFLHECPAFKTWSGGDITYELNAFDAGPRYLFLNMKTPFTDKGLAALVGLEGLFAINFFATTGFAPFDDSRSTVTSAGVAHLVRLSNLGWIGCCARLGSDQTMEHVAAMPKLRMLFGQDMVAGDAGFAALSQSRTIEYINGRRCDNLNTRGFAALAAMPALRGLSMSCKHVGDEGFSVLPTFPALRELTLSDVPDAGYRHIGRCPRLESLWLGKDTTDTAIAHIGGLTTLRRVGTLSPHVTDQATEVLASMSSLESIELHRCRGVTDAGVARLAALPRLKEIALVGLPGVTRAATDVFAPGVKVRYSTD